MLLQTFYTCKGMLYPWVLLEQSTRRLVSNNQKMSNFGKRTEVWAFNIIISNTKKTRLGINEEHTNDIYSDKVVQLQDNNKERRKVK